MIDGHELRNGPADGLFVLVSPYRNEVRIPRATDPSEFVDGAIHVLPDDKLLKAIECDVYLRTPVGFVWTGTK